MPSLYHCQNKSSTNKKQGNWTKRNFLLNSFRLWILLLYLSGLLDDQIDHIVEEEEEWDDDITLVAVKVV